MASLGLSRIANSLVGDATRRGVSGGEKKRVNIGIELMKQPKILFLDEVRSFRLDSMDFDVLILTYYYYCSTKPTSGLDSRSAFVVMESLQRLCNQGMTVGKFTSPSSSEILQLAISLIYLQYSTQLSFSHSSTSYRYLCHV